MQYGKNQSGINPEEIRENDMKLFIRNDKRHREAIKYLLNLLQSHNIDIPSESLKDYVSNIGRYDCMWEDFRKESDWDGN